MRAALPAITLPKPNIGPIRYEFNAVRNINFQKVLDRRTDYYDAKAGPREQGALTIEANRYTMKLYSRAQIKINRHRLVATKASFNLLICLREGHKLPKSRARRDETSAYTHELAQIIYGVWLFEERTKIDKKMRERLAANDLHPLLHSVKGVNDRRLSRLLLQTREELDIVGAVASNHDSMEDLDLGRHRLVYALAKTAANDNVITRVANIIGNISKAPGERPASWMKRAQKTEMTLLCKMLDRSHNVATMLGSGRNEQKIQNYLDETELLLKLANNKIRRNGTLTYMAQYLYDQIDLLRLYCDVKNDKAPMQQLADKMDKAVRDYRTSTIDRDIHPMLCIVGRILKDPELVSNLSVPETVLAAMPFDPQDVVLLVQN